MSEQLSSAEHQRVGAVLQLQQLEVLREIRVAILNLSEVDQHRVLDAAKTIRSAVKAAGHAGVLALACVGAEQVVGEDL